MFNLRRETSERPRNIEWKQYSKNAYKSDIKIFLEITNDLVIHVVVRQQTKVKHKYII